jgi:hypothetical protein
LVVNQAPQFPIIRNKNREQKMKNKRTSGKKKGPIK